MAIPDLLWTCPFCGFGARLRPQRRGAVCPACSTRFRRSAGASIAAERPDGPPIRLAAVDWLERLPPIGSLIERAADTGVPVRSARVRLRIAVGERSVGSGSEYLGRYEVFDEPRSGTLTLTLDQLAFRSPRTEPGRSAGDDAGRDRGEDAGRQRGEDGGDRREHRWSLESLTAVQASSSTLQIKRRHEPVASLRFEDDSIRLWEALIQRTLQRLYRERGRGEIREFQPRITTAASSPSGP